MPQRTWVEICGHTSHSTPTVEKSPLRATPAIAGIQLPKEMTAVRRMASAGGQKRVTGIEPATFSLEG